MIRREEWLGDRRRLGGLLCECQRKVVENVNEQDWDEVESVRREEQRSCAHSEGALPRRSPTKNAQTLALVRSKAIQGEEEYQSW